MGPALAYGRDKRCVFRHTSKVRPFLFLFLGLSLFHVSSVLPGDLIARTPHVIRRGGCRQRDAPLDPLLLFASCLCKVESFHALQLASSVHSVVVLRNRSTFLIPPSGSTLEPSTAEGLTASLPMLLLSSSPWPFRVLGRGGVEAFPELGSKVLVLHRMRWLVGTLIDVALLLRTCYDLMEM